MDETIQHRKTPIGIRRWQPARSRKPRIIKPEDIVDRGPWPVLLLAALIYGHILFAIRVDGMLHIAAALA